MDTHFSPFIRVLQLIMKSTDMLKHFKELVIKRLENSELSLVEILGVKLVVDRLHITYSVINKSYTEMSIKVSVFDIYEVPVEIYNRIIEEEED